jgi:NSS family neurotransmitter:Na+ symporter
MEMLEEQRENWGSRGGFILAAIGSAVGLGNLWGFPYKLYSYGGGAFLIPYITAMFCIGIPMLILEFSLGHFTQRAAPDAFAKAHRKLEFVGWWGIILGFVIITYYPVILAYCFSFMKYSLESIIYGKPLPWAGQGLQGVENAKTFFNETYLGKTEGPALGDIRTHIVIPLIIAWLSMYFCIFKGVKLVGKIVWLTVPLPWLMLLILTVRGLTLPGSVTGLVYYLDPVWSELAKPTTWRFAFGQVFFSLSLAFGVMITYASFLHRKSDINNNAAIIGLADFGTSFIAGLAIFSTLGGMAFVTQQAGDSVGVDKVLDAGPGLAFVAFPYALAQLPGAPWWSLIFFFTLVTLGIDSAFSITESVLAALVDKTGWRRSIVLPLMSLVGLLFGMVYVTQGGLNWLGTIDGFINGTWGIAFLGLLECIVLGWFYHVDNLRVHANERSDWQLGKWWNYAIRIFIPIVLGTLCLWSLFDDLTSQGGFLMSPQGDWNLFNCVGMAVVGIVPAIAVIMSLIRNPVRDTDDTLPRNIHNPNLCAGRLGGLFALLLGVVSAVMIAVLPMLPDSPDKISHYFLFQSLGLGLASLILSNYLLDKYTGAYTFPSWFARWAGIIATLDISAFLAVTLINLTARANTTEIQASKGEHLVGVSYVILSIVFLLIIGGLGWCFYRAITGASKDEPAEPQPGEETDN